MTSALADKSGSYTLSVTGYREHYRIPGVLLGSKGNRGRQDAYAQQIERRGHESEHPAHPCLSAVRRFPEIGDGFHPAEDCMRPLAQALTDDEARMAGGSANNGRILSLAVLGHMRQGIQDVHRLDKRLSMRGLITTAVKALPAGKGRCQVRTEKALLILGKGGSKCQVI